LGIKNLKLLNFALRMRWCWLALSVEDRPWHGLEVDIAYEAKKMFQSCTIYTAGNGKKMGFWTDRWIQGRSIEDIAPNLMPLV
jgi:hypothetical protein